jgi:hypothetical protein
MCTTSGVLVEHACDWLMVVRTYLRGQQHHHRPGRMTHRRGTAAAADVRRAAQCACCTCATVRVCNLELRRERKRARHGGLTWAADPIRAGYEHSVSPYPARRTAQAVEVTTSPALHNRWAGGPVPAPPLSPPHRRVWPARQSRRQDAVLPEKQRTLDPRIGTVEGRRDAASSSVAHGERAWKFAVATISANLNVAGSYHWRTVQQRLCRLKQEHVYRVLVCTMPAGCVHPVEYGQGHSSLRLVGPMTPLNWH